MAVPFATILDLVTSAYSNLQFEEREDSYCIN